MTVSSGVTAKGVCAVRREGRDAGSSRPLSSVFAAVVRWEQVELTQVGDGGGGAETG